MIIKLDRTDFKRRLWHRAFNRSLKQYSEALAEGLNVEAAQKYAFYGIKYLGTWTKVYSGIVATYSQKELEAAFMLYDTVLDSLIAITPRQLIGMFPVKKEFDGKRWEMKDYYTTMEMIEANGMDEPIENPFEFLWDYWNWDTHRFLMNYLSVISELRKRETGTTPIEEFLKGGCNGENT
ncbi:hypothetical protein [Enterococcus innesii]|uniref:hypothetical protein n=1 Tax=Enterococcus innesii TaxID=2839759 RepID=UPI002DB62238|nr:hypothetical protein [Enterococcus innesii]MEB5950644.1 hypothetical protein [Enterococcus innesii]